MNETESMVMHTRNLLPPGWEPRRPHLHKMRVWARTGGAHTCTKCAPMRESVGTIIMICSVPTYPPTYIPTYIPTYLPAYIPTYLLTLPTCIPTHLPNYIPYLPAHLPTLLTYPIYLPTCLPAYLPTYPTYLPYLSYLPAYLPTSLPANLLTYLSTCLHVPNSHLILTYVGRLPGARRRCAGRSPRGGASRFWQPALRVGLRHEGVGIRHEGVGRIKWGRLSCDSYFLLS
jgi:hypothetical protein